MLEFLRGMMTLMSRCALFSFCFSLTACLADDWPQWLGPKRDSIWREAGIVQTFPKDGPPVLWRVPIGGGYSGPAVANGRVYVTDRKVASDASNPSNPFARGIIPGSERVLCLDEKSGKVVWQHEYDCPYSMSYASGPQQLRW